MSIKDKEKRNLLFKAITNTLEDRGLMLHFFDKVFIGEFVENSSGEINLLGKLTPSLIGEFEKTRLEDFSNLTDQVRLKASYIEVQNSIKEDEYISLNTLLTGFFCPIKFPNNNRGQYNVYTLVKIGQSSFASLFPSDSIPDEEFLTIYELTDLYYKHITTKA